MKEKIAIAAVLLFLFTQFFPNFPLLTGIASGCFLLTFFLYNSWKEKMMLLRQRKVVFWMLGFFGVILLSMMLSDHPATAARYLDPRIPLLGMPISIGLVYFTKEQRDRILISAAMLISGCCLVLFGYGLYRWYHTHDSSLLFNDSLTQLSGQQSIYISLLVNISIYIFGYYIFFRPIKSSTQRSWMVVAIMFLFGINFLLASRNMMLLLYISTLGFCIWFVFAKKRYLEGMTMVIGLALALFFIVKFHPKTLNRFRELNYTSYNYNNQGPESHYNVAVTADQWNGANFRLAAWKCGWEIFMAHPILGVGLGDKRVALQEKYREKNFQFAIQTKKNLHNNYLDIMMSMGLIGLAVFLVAWLIKPFILFRKTHDGLAMVVLITLAVAMFTEVYFDRSLGGMLFGFFICVMLTDKGTILRKSDEDEVV